MQRTTLLTVSTALLLSACAVDSTKRPPSDAAPIQAAWVQIGDQGQTIARAITTQTDPEGSPTGANCPAMVVDGVPTRMALRSGPGTAAQRPTASAAAESKPSAFPVTVCEATVPPRARTASVAGHALPLPKAEPRRVIVLADTGCRMKKSDNAWQDCNHPDTWPFAALAATAARMNPDLVLHIGDYHYRENACPAHVPGCQDSPWGYGWDTWQADFFQPAAPLLAQAPWIMARGNHEECARAGQGWFRFLDARPFENQRSCDHPANDGQANYSEPFAVPLGSDSQVIVFDSAKAGRSALKPTDAPFAIYQKQFQTVARLAAKTGMENTLFANHHPVLAFFPLTGAAPAPGNAALQSVMASLNAQSYYPPGIHLALHGHVHDFQAIDFASGHPATIVSGNAGDTLEVALPEPFPATLQPAPGVQVGQISHHNSFGFVLMERRPAPETGWSFQAYSVSGKRLATCLQNGTALRCDKTGLLTP